MQIFKMRLDVETPGINVSLIVPGVQVFRFRVTQMCWDGFEKQPIACIPNSRKFGVVNPVFLRRFGRNTYGFGADFG